MTNNNLKVVVTQNYEETKSKEEHIADYIESLVAIEEAMEPYKQQKRDLKKDYLEKQWLSKEDISLSVRALRLLKDDIDIPQLMDAYIALRRKHGVQREDEDE
tara:strand:- start:888 stop:1196 length:309 start_codon:yes stop_codon:yes gene_type:complete